MHELMETRCFHLISLLGFIFGLGLGDVTCQSNAQVSGYELNYPVHLHTQKYSLRHSNELYVSFSNFVPLFKEGTQLILGSAACSSSIDVE